MNLFASTRDVTNAPTTDQPSNQLTWGPIREPGPFSESQNARITWLNERTTTWLRDPNKQISTVDVARLRDATQRQPPRAWFDARAVPPSLAQFVPPFYLDTLLWMFEHDLASKGKDLHKKLPAQAKASATAPRSPEAVSPWAFSSGHSSTASASASSWSSDSSSAAPAAAFEPSTAAAPATAFPADGSILPLAVECQRQLLSQAHAFAKRLRRKPVQAHLTGKGRDYDNQWHPLTADDVTRLVDGGAHLDWVGIAADTAHIQIKWGAAHPAWDQAIEEQTTPEQRNTLRVCAIDPGTDTFLTVYLLHPNCCLRIGHGAASRMDRHFSAQRRKLQSRRDVHRRQMCDSAAAAAVDGVPATPVTAEVEAQVRAWANDMKRWSNRQADYVTRLHNIAVRLLTAVASFIVMPEYRTGDMRTRANKLSAAISRKQGHLSFFKFRTKLESRCLGSGIPLLLLDEHFTTATCSQCGAHNRHVGIKKVAKCPSCGFVACRDGGAACTLLKKCLYVASCYSVPAVAALVAAPAAAVHHMTMYVAHVYDASTTPRHTHAC